MTTRTSFDGWAPAQSTTTVRGILGYVPGPVGLIAKVVGVIAGAGSAFVAWTPTINASCILNMIGAAVAGAGFGLGVAVAVKKALGQLVPVLLQAFDGGLCNSTDGCSGLIVWTW